MSKVKIAVSAVVFGLLTTVNVLNAATFNTTGVYDSTNNGNAIDRTAIGNAPTFTTSVAAAYTANQGGVVDFDGTGTFTDPGAINARFGTGFSKTLAITTSQYNVQFSSNITGISGTDNSGTGLFLFANPAVQVETYNFGAITGGQANEAVTQAAITLLTRRNGGGGTPTVTVRAFYSNLTSQSAAASFTLASAADEDTFFGFTAPVGASITRLEVDYGAAGDLRRGIDDFGFITSVVPEPTSVAVLALGGLAALRRRRA